MELAHRVTSIKASETMQITALAESMKRAGKDVIVLAAGQPDFPTPEFIKNAGREALDKNHTRYTAVDGTVDFKEAIRKKFIRDNGLDYNLDEIIVGSGGKHVLFNAVLALLNPGEEAIIPTPYWVSYPSMVELADGVSVYLNTTLDDQFLINPDKLRRAITDKTKLIFLNSPSNPTGMLYTKELLIEIGNICLERDITILSDELYEYLTYDGETAHSIASLEPAFKDITLTINGLSKAFSMTGWRIGYAGGPKNIIRAMSRLQSHSTSNASSIAQYAGITALSKSKEDLKDLFQVFVERREITFERLSNIPNIETIKPQGAFYVFPKVSGLYGTRYKNYEVTDSLSFCSFMLEEMLISPVPGIAFGNDDHVRISYALSTEELITGLERFEEGIKKLS
jgi:aspartate aminotransferase